MRYDILFSKIINKKTRKLILKAILYIKCLIPNIKFIYKNLKLLKEGARVLKEHLTGKSVFLTLY
jgi:hypothetical protein